MSAEGRVPASAELRSVAPRGGLLLVYHVGPGESWVFIVPPQGRIEALPLTIGANDAAVLGAASGPLTESALERIITGDTRAGGEHLPGIADLLGGMPTGGYVALGMRAATGPDSFELRMHALWRTLVPTPLWKRVARARSAVVIPDAALHLVAFEALVTRPRAAGARDGTRYWIDDGPALTYGPSATALAGIARRPRAPSDRFANQPVLSVSNVAFAADPSASAPPAEDPTRGTLVLRGRRWSPLPGTAQETDAIRSAFGPGRVTVLEGTKAGERAVCGAITRHRYVHLATHGFVEPQGSRLVAGLVFAAPSGAVTSSDDDGMLELFEIHRLAVACDLAVLSACETARGSRVAGEGTFALSRGFLAAGARRVVASLWAVGDRPTAAIVGSLFTSIAAAGKRGAEPDVATELRDAKLRVRRDPRWADPFHWAPFVVSGL